MKYLINCSGCDDSTQITIDLTDKQFAFVKYLADQITETSTYGCMPRLYVDKLDEVEEWTLNDPREVMPFNECL